MLFDALAVRGRAVGAAPFGERMRAIGDEVRLPFRTVDEPPAAAAAAAAAAAPRLPLYLMGKTFLPAEQSAVILSYITHSAAAAAAPHSPPISSALAPFESAMGDAPPHRMYRHGLRVNGTDGLVLTPLAPPYIGLFASGQATCAAPLIKWKWADEHTVDFRLRRCDLDEPRGGGGGGGGGGARDGPQPVVLAPPLGGGAPLFAVPLFVGLSGDREQSVARALFDGAGLAAYARAMDERGIDSLIVEAGYEASVSAWAVRRVRDRKTKANFITTAWNTLEVLAENLSQVELVAALQARGAAAAAAASSSSSGGGGGGGAVAAPPAPP
jgi:hypothetical protein